MRGFLSRIRRVLCPGTTVWLQRDRTSVKWLLNALSTPWEDRTREQKRLTAPYALGWEEGYAAAYAEFRASGRVAPLPNKRTATLRATWSSTSSIRD